MKPAPRETAGPDAPDERVARYLKNLGALYGQDPALAAVIDGLPFRDVPPLEHARDGNPTVRMAFGDGPAVYIHSRYRPLEEARKFVAGQLEARATDEEDADRAHTFVIAGAGLGYHLLELERQCERPALIVAEGNPGLIKAAFCTVDLAEIITDGRLLFLTTPDKPVVYERLKLCSTDLMLGFRFVALPGALRVAQRFHTRMRELVADFVGYYKTQVLTLLSNARITCKNIAFNLPSYLAQPGVEVLQNRAAGYPAIIVAAGPSLARSIARLGELRERAVIIAVQTVFKLLLARGTPPHFVVSLDFHEVSRQFFDGLAEVGGSILVAEPKATWHVLDTYPGRKHVLHARFVDDLLRDAGPARAALKPGSTVAHLAFYLAEWLGCDPIMFIGQDLSFSEGIYYPPGMPIERIWQTELGRFQTLEMKQWERIVRARPILQTVKDIHGRDTYTDEQLLSYAEQFQADFLASAARVIHAGEAGMKLEGMDVMTLGAAAERFCTRRLPDDLFAADAAPAEGLKERACAAVQRRIAEVREVRGIAGEMSGLLEELTTLTERPVEFNRIIVRVDDLRALIQKHGRTYQLVVDVSQTAELRRYSADRKIGQDVRETAVTARRRLRRDREFVEAFIEGCEYLESILPEALTRMRERM